MPLLQAPDCLHQVVSDSWIAVLGDRSLPPPFPRGVLSRTQSRVAGDLAPVFETIPIQDLRTKRAAVKLPSPLGNILPEVWKVISLFKVATSFSNSTAFFCQSATCSRSQPGNLPPNSSHRPGLHQLLGACTPCTSIIPCPRTTQRLRSLRIAPRCRATQRVCSCSGLGTFTTANEHTRQRHRKYP